MGNDPAPPFVLFGYDSSAFTTKIRLALKLRQIPHTFIIVPSMMPRPVLLSSFNLTYRKIPVLAIGKEVYIDTSLILEAIALHPSYPPSSTHPPLHPTPQHRVLARIFASHYTDRPLFRLTTGLIPQVVWETSFGTDRAGLIGHTLDPGKLGAKVSRNLAGLDTYLSILEPLLSSRRWLLDTLSPTAFDIALYYQLMWANDISRGIGVHNLTGGAAPDSSSDEVKGMTETFNHKRYPNLLTWFDHTREFFKSLPNVETTRIERANDRGIDAAISILSAAEQAGPVPLLPTAVQQNKELDERNGLVIGTRVTVVPDDTGRDDPTFGTLVALSTEEVVIVPDLIDERAPKVEGVRIHFPRIGFVVRPLQGVHDGDEVELKITALAKKAKL